MPMVMDGLYSVSIKAPDPTKRAAVELLARVREDGPVVKFGTQTIGFESGHISLSDGPFVPMPGVKPEEPLDIVFVTRYNDVAIYVNGEMFTSHPAAEPTKITYLRKDWSTSLQGFVTYVNPLSPTQIKRNAVAAAQFAKGEISTSGGSMVLEAELDAFTPVPDPARIKPYRNALLAQEYKVLRVVEPGVGGVKPGDTVRVFRYGVLDGQRTAMKNLKAGDRVRIKIDLLSAYPALEREYQLDSLDTTFGATYVEVPNVDAGSQARD